MNEVPEIEPMFSRALELVDGYSKELLSQEGNTWGPRYVKVAARLAGREELLLGTLGFPEPWDPAWGDEEVDFVPIARNKLDQALRAGGRSRNLVGVSPWLLEAGDYLAAGGVAEPDESLAVGVSGAFGWVDEAIAEVVIVTMRHLYQRWMAGLQERGAGRIEPRGGEGP